MGRRVAYLLVFVGFFLLFFSLLLRFYAYPRVQKAPLNQYSQPVATGTGTYFNRKQLREVTARLENIRTVKGDAGAGNERTAVWDSFSATRDLDGGGLITADQERVALDRVSAESRHCCGERPRHEGLTLKFPFNTRKTTYSFWDPTAGRAFPAAYVAEERIRGVKVYRFEQHFSGIRLQTLNVSGAQAGRPELVTVPATIVYGNDKTIWVEPRTGRVIKAGQNLTQILQTDDGRPVLTAIRAQLLYDDATVRTNAEEASSAVSKLRMVQLILPVAALVLGIPLVVLGTILLARQTSRQQEPATPTTLPADAR